MWNWWREGVVEGHTVSYSCPAQQHFQDFVPSPAIKVSNRPFGMAKIYIGTSGWHYGHWVGPFYPRSMKSGQFLPFYAERFCAAEINNTFYKLPDQESLTAWRNATPQDFVFACKASRFITHMKKLRDPRDTIRRFFQSIEALDPKAGPILFQLPPRWHFNPERLKAFLEALPKDYRYGFEFRDDSWFVPETYRMLSSHNAAFCIYELAGARSPVELTADLVYVRLHGPGSAYRGSYDDAALSGWLRQFSQWRSNGRDVYCFFDNDEKGYAALNAQRMTELLARE